MFISVKEVEKEQPTHSLGEPRPHANGRGGAGTERGKEREEKGRTTIRTKDSQTQNTYSELHRTGGQKL